MAVEEKHEGGHNGEKGKATGKGQAEQQPGQIQEDPKPLILSDKGGQGHATVELFDKGQAVKIEDPSKIVWNAAPDNILKLEPQADGSVKLTTTEGTFGSVQLAATDPKSGQSASGTVQVKSSKPTSRVVFG